MRRTPHATPIAALVLALALGGCGGSSTPAVKVVAVPLHSSAIHSARLSPRYTCDGKDISPPLTWGAIPAEVEELALFALQVTPATAGRYTLTVAWAMAGVEPALHHLAAGEIPKGAFVLQASNGKRQYTICPPQHQTQRYEFALYALPPHVHAGPNINATELLTNLTSTIPTNQAPARGAILTTYTRK
jgi:phosphatidylethanolamine-binding protein (PEBP) family uncharacterized protein